MAEQEKKTLTAQDIKNTFITLSYSQGMYGRLLRDIEGSEDPESIYLELEAQKFTSPVDLVLFIET